MIDEEDKKLELERLKRTRKIGVDLEGMSGKWYELSRLTNWHGRKAEWIKKKNPFWYRSSGGKL